MIGSKTRLGINYYLIASLLSLIAGAAVGQISGSRGKLAVDQEYAGRPGDGAYRR